MQTLPTQKTSLANTWAPACAIVAACANNYKLQKVQTITQTVYIGSTRLKPVTIALTVNNKLAVVNATVYGYGYGVSVSLLFAVGAVCPKTLSYACRAAAKLSAASPN